MLRYADVQQSSNACSEPFACTLYRTRNGPPHVAIFITGMVQQSGGEPTCSNTVTLLPFVYRKLVDTGKEQKPHSMQQGYDSAMPRRRRLPARG